MRLNRNHFFTRYATLFLLHGAALVAYPQSYPAKWASLDKRPVPQWWSDAKFGIFIHWGVYSVPAYAPVNEVEGVYDKYAEHYENRLLQKNPLFLAHHKKYFGNKTYRDLAADFKAEYFNPDEWAQLFARSGARYVVLTSKHHDGFCLWPSRLRAGWNSVSLGPKRDLAAALGKSVREASPVKNTVVVNDRWGQETGSLHGGYTTEYDLVGDRKGIGKKAVHPWEESRGIGTSYGLNRFETLDHYLGSGDLVKMLIAKVADGGNFLLNIGPDANGLIPVIMRERLLDIGAWLKVNGEAIYGTSAWRERLPRARGSNLYFTRKGKDLFVICTSWPLRGIRVPAAKQPTAVKRLGSSAPVSSRLDGGVLSVSAPKLNPGALPCNHAWTFKISGIF